MTVNIHSHGHSDIAIDKLLRIGELAKRSGKSVRALHLYEELGLLKPEVRSQGGFRLYHHSSVARVLWINKLQDAGFSLNELKDLLADVGQQGVAPEAMRRVRAVFEQKLAETREAVARLSKLETDLQDSLTYLEGCKGCAPVHTVGECSVCTINGHQGEQPILVAGLHNQSGP